jgi:dolichol-phosphate mannosyltransferase
VTVLHRTGKLGLGTAYVLGFWHALAHPYERIVEMDADFSHRPTDLVRLLQAAEHADVVVGSRNVPGGRVVGWSPLRHFVSKGGSLYARLLLGLAVRDCTSGFKCFRRRALEALDLSALRSNGYAFQVEVNYACARAGLRVAEVPIVFPDRTRGTSKMSWRIAAEAAVLVLRLRLGLSRVPLAPVASPKTSTHEAV